MLEHALRYLKRGWSPIPVMKGTKDRVLLPSWREFVLRKPSLGEVNRWWGLYRNANIALVCGFDFVAVDIDDESGLELFEKYGGLPVTPTIKSRRGPKLLFKPPSGVELKNYVKRLPGIDIRTQAAYVIAPPSEVDGFVYTWEHYDADLAEFPDWLLALLTSPESTDLEIPEWVIESLVTGVEEGQRDNTLTKLLGWMAGEGWSKEQAFATLCAWDRLNKPPLGREYVWSKIKSHPHWFEKGVTLPVLTLQDIFRAEFDPQPWIMWPLVPKDGTALLASPYGVGKTLTSQVLAMHVAAGKSFGIFPCYESRNVLLIEEEISLREVFLRSKALVAGYEFEEDLGFMVTVHAGFRLDDRWFGALARTVRERNIGLVIIDSLIRVHTSNENSPSDMARLYNDYLKPLKSAGVSVLVIHHTAKGPDEHVRGTGEIGAQVDVVMKLRREEFGNDFWLEWEKVNVFGGRPSGRVKFSIESEPDRLSLVVADVEGDDILGDPHVVDMFLDLLRTPKSYSEVASQVSGLSSTAALRVCESLANRGLVTRYEGGRYGPRRTLADEVFT